MSIDGMNNSFSIPQPDNIPEDLIEQLPDELIRQIISELGNMNLPPTLLVSKKFSKGTIDFIKKKEADMVQQFVDFLSQNLDPNSSKRSELKEMMENQIILKSINLNKVKENLSQVKERMISFLKELNEEDFKTLEKLSKTHEIPTLFKDVFILAKLEKKYLFCANDYTQLDTFFSTLEIQDIDKMIAIIMKSHPEVTASGQVNENNQKNTVLQFLYEKVDESNQFQDVIDQLSMILNTVISNGGSEYEMSGRIDVNKLNNLIVNKGIDSAIKFLYQINNETIRTNLLKSLVKTYAFEWSAKTTYDFINALSDVDKDAIIVLFLETKAMHQPAQFSFNNFLVVANLIQDPKKKEEVIQDKIREQKFNRSAIEEIKKYVNLSNFSDSYKKLILEAIAVKRIS